MWRSAEQVFKPSVYFAPDEPISSESSSTESRISIVVLPSGVFRSRYEGRITPESAQQAKEYFLQQVGHHQATYGEDMPICVVININPDFGSGFGPTLLEDMKETIDAMHARRPGREDRNNGSKLITFQNESMITQTLAGYFPQDIEHVSSEGEAIARAEQIIGEYKSRQAPTA